jgi:PPOX class probable F420-dependent enzyme
MALIDETSAFGARVAGHLRDEIVVWMTTITPDAKPLPSPIWFLWDGGDSVLMFSRSDSPRIRNVPVNPNVSLNFGGDGHGGDIVVLSGEATIDRGAPAADAIPAYLLKYAGEIERLGWTQAQFAADYNVAVRIRLTGLRGH